MTAQKSSFCATSAGPRWAPARAAALKSAAWAWWKRLFAENAPARVAALRRKVRRLLEIIHRTVGGSAGGINEKVFCGNSDAQAGFQVEGEGGFFIGDHVPAAGVELGAFDGGDG